MLDLKRKGYRLQRTASLGASLTLVSGAGEYSALFECATKCAEVLGDRQLKDLGDGFIEFIPSYKIPTEEINGVLQKLSKRFSVALIEYVCDKTGGRFVPIWRIEKSQSLSEITPKPLAAPIDLDEY